MIGSVPLGLIITQFFSSRVIFIPSEVSELGNSSFNENIILLAFSSEHSILSLVVNEGGN